MEAPAKSNNLARILLFQSLRYLAIGYRAIVKQKNAVSVSNDSPIFSDSTSAAELHKNIRSEVRFEHLISTASERYRLRRREIADTYYGQ